MTRNALVSGATGFVGSHLVPRLLDEGWQVTVLVRPSSALPAKWASAVDSITDTGDTSELTTAVTKAAPDVCFHLATKFVGVHQPGDVNDLIESNIAAGTRLLEALSALPDVAFVNVGTIWQHFDARPYGPTSLYAATKQAFCDIVQYYAECTNLRAVTVELTDTYGPADQRKKLVQLLAEAAETGTTLAMSPGKQLFDLLHVSDAVRGLVMAADLADHESRRFALYSDKVHNLREFVDLFSGIVGRPISIDWGARPYRPREMLSSWRTTEPLPDWKPEIELREGLSALFAPNAARRA